MFVKEIGIPFSIVVPPKCSKNKDKCSEKLMKLVLDVPTYHSLRVALHWGLNQLRAQSY